MVVTKHVVDVVTHANEEADRKVLLASGPRHSVRIIASSVLLYLSVKSPAIRSEPRNALPRRSYIVGVTSPFHSRQDCECNCLINSYLPGVGGCPIHWTASGIHYRNKCGVYQRAYVANPNRSTSHQSTRTLRIHRLYSVMRNLCGNTFVPTASKMYSPPISAMLPSAACA